MPHSAAPTLSDRTIAKELFYCILNCHIIRCSQSIQHYFYCLHSILHAEALPPLSCFFHLCSNDPGSVTIRLIPRYKASLLLSVINPYSLPPSISRIPDASVVQTAVPLRSRSRDAFRQTGADEKITSGSMPIEIRLTSQKGDCCTQFHALEQLPTILFLRSTSQQVQMRKDRFQPKLSCYPDKAVRGFQRLHGPKKSHFSEGRKSHSGTFSSAIFRMTAVSDTQACTSHRRPCGPPTPSPALRDSDSGNMAVFVCFVPKNSLFRITLLIVPHNPHCSVRKPTSQQIISSSHRSAPRWSQWPFLQFLTVAAGHDDGDGILIDHSLYTTFTRS